MVENALLPPFAPVSQRTNSSSFMGTPQQRGCPSQSDRFLAVSSIPWLQAQDAWRSCESMSPYDVLFTCHRLRPRETQREETLRLRSSHGAATAERRALKVRYSQDLNQWANR